VPGRTDWQLGAGRGYPAGADRHNPIGSGQFALIDQKPSFITFLYDAYRDIITSNIIVLVESVRRLGLEINEMK
jgi:hypothetical protein